MDFFPEIPGYNIESKIAEGRVSEVYLGVQEDLDRKVAIKVLNPELFAKAAVAREFQKATKALTQMAHPNMVRILEAGEHNGIYFVVMEYLPDSLRNRIPKPFEVTGNAVAEPQHKSEPGPAIEGFAIITLFKQLVQVLDFVHQDGIVMQDLRPENIRFREDGSPALMGFFLARIFAAGIFIPNSSTAKRLPFYVSPEKALGKPLNNTSDFYSLGIILFELVTGSVPFNAEEAIAVENQHIMEPVPRLPGAHSHFQAAIDGLMAKNPEDRITSANGIIKVLDDLSYIMPENRRSEKREFTVPPPPDPVSLFFDEPTLQMSAPAAPQASGTVEAVAGLPEEFVSEGLAPDGSYREFPEPAGSLDEIAVPDSNGDEDLIPSMDEFGVDTKQKKNKKESKKFALPKISMPEFNFDMDTLMEKIREPRVIIPVVGVLVIIIVLAIFLGPSDESGEPSRSASPTTQAAGSPTAPGVQLTPEQLQELEQNYQHKLSLAKRAMNKNQFKAALDRLKEAESLKKTEEIKTLIKQINDRMATQKDDNSFKKAQSQHTVAAYESYQEQYPSGRHTAEAEDAVKQLKEEKRKQEADIRRRLASSVRLRSQGKDLTTEEAKSMLSKYNFFDKYYNKSGNFKNHFVLQTLNKDTVVVDYSTALMWHQAGSPLYMKWNKVDEWLKEFNKKGYAGFNDWRLPTLEEAISLMEPTEALGALFLDKIFDREQRFIWTSDRYSGSKVWAVDYFGGDVNRVGTYFEAYIRPVRNLTAGSN